MLKHLIITAGMVALATPIPASAAQSGTTKPAAQVEELERCRAIASAEQRLQCYDAAADALIQATKAGNLVVVDRETITKTRRSLFGLSLPRLPLFGGGDGEEHAGELETTIRAARSVDYAKWLITVEDGAVWQTVDPDTRSRDPRPGDPVTIRRGSLGNYLISWTGSRTLSAKRLR